MVASRLYRLLFLSHFLIAMSGCGAAVERSEPYARKPIAIEGVIPILLVSRPTPGLVQLSLWVDAGSRDASPPQVATVAAWIAAGRAGTDLQTYVVPDGIEFSMRCGSRELEKCLTSMRTALNARNPREGELRSARLRLIEARLLAQAQDRLRSADRLAFKALWGRGAESLFPLGERNSDDRVTKASVRGFLSAHFGPARALLVAVGELRASDLSRAVQKAFTNNSKARAKRAQRTLRAASEAVAVEIDTIDAVTIAAVTPDLVSAIAIGRSLHLSLASERFASPVEPTTHVFQLRGAALVSIRLSGVRDPIAVVRYASSEFFRLRVEGVDNEPAVGDAESVREVARAVGARWCSQDERPPADHYALGIGVIVKGGRADRPRDDQPDAEQKESLRVEVEQALRSGRRVAEPEIVGELDEDFARVTAPNGAKILVERRASDKVAVSVRFAGGARRDPPALHGRAALLATLAATSCGKYPADLLTARLEEMDATLEPLVDSEYWGVVLVAPKKWWRQAVEICTACAFRPSLVRDDLATARVRLLERFGKTATPLRFASQAAFVISPASAGLVAPWGSHDRLANISLGELTDLFHGSALGEAVTIAALGDLPVVEATRRVARRVAHLARGSLTRFEPPSDSSSNLLALWSSDSRIRAVVAWRAKGAAIGKPGATAFVLQMRKQLAKMPGIEPVWHDAAARGWGSWAAIALRLSEEALPTLEQSVSRATRTISLKDLSELIDTTIEKDRIASVIASAQLKYAVKRLGENPSEKSAESRSREAALKVARDLLASPARFAISRPRR